MQAIEAAEGGCRLLEEYNETQCLSASNRKRLVNITVDAMVEKFGHRPSSDEKTAYAKEIIKLFPKLRDPTTPEGYVSTLFHYFTLLLPK